MAVLAAVARHLRSCALLALALLALPAGEALAQEAAEFQIKAAFLRQFVTYVQGPGTAFEDAATPLIFGVAGSNSVQQFLTELVAAQQEGPGAEVRRVTSVADLAGVHVLFVGDGATGSADVLLAEAVQASMLTVTDLEGPQPANSMIHFFVADDRVRFDIALAPAEAAGLRLSSRLLQVARRVIENE